MLTYSTALSTLQALTKVPITDTANSALLIQFWNDSRRTVGGIRGGNWPWRLFEKTVLTTADVEYVYIPNDMERVTAVRTTVGTGNQVTVYIPKLVYDEQKWQVVLAMRLGTNQYPYFVFQRGQKLLMNPIPSETDTPVILMGRKAIKDINIVDYTTGSVLTATPDSTAIVGSGTSWTTSMAGRYIRITESDTNNKGDGAWYEIATVGSATTLTLVKPYQGTAIVAGSAAYTLGQITYEPEMWQMAPIWRAAAQWIQLNDPLHPDRYNAYWKLYDGGVEAGLLPPGSPPGGMISQMLEEAGETFDGHYISPNRNELDGWPGDYYYPWQQGTGMN